MTQFKEAEPLEKLIKYFIIPTIIYSTSGSDLPTTINYLCRVIDPDYNEIFSSYLNEKDMQSFKSIMESDKNALLYRTHEILGQIAYWKIDNHQKKAILDAVKYP